VTSKITIAAPPPVVRVISSGPGWLTLLVTFLLGAALTLIVQLYLVPRVETRKRREDRWERNVLELGELLTTQVRRLGQEARSAQSTFRFLHQGLEGVSGLDEDKLEQARREQAPKTQQATEDFHDLVNTRVDWLVDRIRSFTNPEPRILSKFDFAARHYWVSAMISHWPEDDPRTESAFEQEWTDEREARRALIRAIERLADLPHPPRASWRQSAEDWRDLLGGADPIPSQGRA
jgi:hypothetical protein